MSRRLLTLFCFLCPLTGAELQCKEGCIGNVGKVVGEWQDIAYQDRVLSGGDPVHYNSVLRWKPGTVPMREALFTVVFGPNQPPFTFKCSERPKDCSPAAGIRVLSPKRVELSIFRKLANALLSDSEIANLIREIGSRAVTPPPAESVLCLGCVRNRLTVDLGPAIGKNPPAVARYRLCGADLKARKTCADPPSAAELCEAGPLCHMATRAAVSSGSSATSFWMVSRAPLMAGRASSSFCRKTPFWRRNPPKASSPSKASNTSKRRSSASSQPPKSRPRASPYSAPCC